MKKTLVNRDDYDFYSIQLPLRLAFSRRLKKAVLKEVEKRHPKLSISSRVDSRFSWNKGKFNADVAVMDGKLLSLYQKRFPGKKLFFGNEKKEKAYFTEKNLKGKILSLALILVFAFFSGKILKEVFMQQEKLKEAEEIYLGGMENEAAEKPDLQKAENVMTSVFASVSKSGGRVNSFAWKNGYCNFSISDCHSEDILQAKNCIVSYRESRPFFSISVPVLEEVIEGLELPGERINQNSFSQIRSKLLSAGAEIKSECMEENGLDLCFVAGQEVLYSVLKILGIETEKIGWVEKSFSVEKKSGKNLVKVFYDRKFENAKGIGNVEFFHPVLLTASYAWLFNESELKLVPVKKKVLTPKFILPATKSENLTKIGEIRKNDGSLLIYYRDSMGKIACEEVGNAM